MNTKSATRYRPQPGVARPQAVYRADEVPPSVSAAWRLLRRWTVPVCLVVALAWSYKPTLLELWEFWDSNPDYSAGMMVPVVMGYLVWSRRDALRRLPMRASYWGLGLLVVAQVLRFAGLLYMSGSVERYSLCLTTWAVLLFIGGWGLVRQMGWVLLFMLLVVPLPHQVHERLTLPLQSFATSSAAFGLELLGYLVAREGNVLKLGSRTTIAVAEACNGLRMLTAFVVVAATLAFMVKGRTWQKACLVLSSIPIAILANTARLVITAVLYEHAGSKVAEQFFHDFAGLTMMPFAVVLLIAVLMLMRLLAGEPVLGKRADAEKPATRTHARPAAQQMHGLRVSIPVTLAVLLACGIAHRAAAARIAFVMSQTLSLKRPLAEIPMHLGEWVGEDEPVDERIQKLAGDDESISRRYSSPDGRVVRVYIGYIGRVRARMGHRPDVCYRTHGFQELSRNGVSVATQGGRSVPMLLFEFVSPELGGPREHVLATYVVNGLYTNDTRKANAYNTRKVDLFSRQTLYMARIQVSIPGSGDVAGDVAELKRFVALLLDPVGRLLPDPGGA